jgi:hypothetical protein
LVSTESLTVVFLRGYSTTYFRKWRHWGCTTKKILENLKKKVGEVDDLDGMDEISEENQAKIRTAWEVGEVADEGMCNAFFF